jgi:hypothetical protein
MRDLEAMLAQLRAAGAQVNDTIQDEEDRLSPDRQFGSP